MVNESKCRLICVQLQRDFLSQCIQIGRLKWVTEGYEHISNIFSDVVITNILYIYVFYDVITNYMTIFSLFKECVLTLTEQSISDDHVTDSSYQ